MEILKNLITLILCIGTVSSYWSQDLTGKWYMVNRSGLVEMDISKDSIINRSLFTDLTPKDDEVRSNQIIKTVQLEDRILLFTPSIIDTVGYSVMTFINFNNNQFFQIAWNSLDTTSNNIDSLIKIHSNDKRKLFGYNIYSQQYLDSLNSMKTIQEMPLNDFKRFAREYVDRIKITSKEFEKFNIGYAAVTYNFQLISQSLFEVGYNPLQNTRTIEPLFKKYFDDPEVQSILKEVRK